jgi:hypothetical protein
MKLWPNKLAGVVAGRKSEFIEMMQVDHGCWSGAARLVNRWQPVEQSKKRRVGAPGLQNFRGNHSIGRPGALTGRLFRQAARARICLPAFR